mgnify:CR=1 FL=1|jgi:hypothetical protein
MRWALATAALFCAAPVAAQSAPYKLILAWGTSTVVIDYPSRDRCLAAVAAVQEEERRLYAAAERSTAGTSAVYIPSTPRAFCIPG